MPQSYPLALPYFRLKVAGTDRTGDLMSRTLVIRKTLGSQVDTCQFSLNPPANASYLSDKPAMGAAVSFEVATGSATGTYVKDFAGYITSVNEVRMAYQKIRWDVACVDNTTLLNRIVVNRTYIDQTVSAIVRSVVREFAPGVDVSAFVSDVEATVQRITFARQYLSDVLTRLADQVGFDWYVDEDKQLHFFDPVDATYLSALEVTNDSGNFMDLAIEPLISQVRNRIYVDGGRALSSVVTEQYDANGVSTVFKLADENIIAQFLASGMLSERFMTINGVPQTVGLQGQVDEANFVGGYLLDDANGIVRVADGGDPPADGARMLFRYQYTLPISVVREDLDSQNTIAELTGEDYATAVEADRPLYWWRMVSEQGTTIEGNQGSTGYGSVGGGGVQGGGGTIHRRVTGALNDKSDGGNWAANFQNAHYYCGSGIRVPQSSYTLEAWVQPDAQYKNRGILGAWANDGANSGGAAIWFSSSGTYSALHGTTAATWITGASAATKPTGGGQYDHVVSSFDGALLTLYVNNQPFSKAVATAPGIVANSGMLIGHFYGQVGLFDGDNGFVGSLDECAVYTSGITSVQVANHYAAGRMAGIREAVVTDNTLVSFAQARQVGDGQLAKYGTVITNIGWSSFVPGWKIGESVNVNVTTAGLGRTFSGLAKIQELTIRAIGGQRLVYDPRCMSVRFNMIDYQRQLARQRDVIGDVGPLSLARFDQTTVLAIPGDVETSALTPPFKVQPDWGTGSTPPIKVGFWEVGKDWT